MANNSGSGMFLRWCLLRLEQLTKGLLRSGEWVKSRRRKRRRERERLIVNDYNGQPEPKLVQSLELNSTNAMLQVMRLACANRGGVAMRSWPLLLTTFSLLSFSFLSPSSAFDLLWGNS